METKKNNLLSVYIAYHNCIDSGNRDWERKHLQSIETAMDDIPHGSGIDCKWDFDFSDKKKIVLSNSYHAMDDCGMYDGYYDFKVVIAADRRDIDGTISFKIVGKFGKYSDIKDYLYELFSSFFSEIDSI